jgi:hypothetical protein
MPAPTPVPAYGVSSPVVPGPYGASVPGYAPPPASPYGQVGVAPTPYGAATTATKPNTVEMYNHYQNTKYDAKAQKKILKNQMKLEKKNKTHSGATTSTATYDTYNVYTMTTPYAVPVPVPYGVPVPSYGKYSVTFVCRPFNFS